MDQVRFVEEPLLCRELRRPAPQETLLTMGPSVEYLHLLDQIAQRNGLKPAISSHVYVSRTEMLQDGMGGHLGETYLVACLEKLGVQIMNPAKLAYPVQLAIYAGADQVIFAEGSAQHARQGLGFVRQEITVLNRRPHTRMGQHLLEPRCKTLRYGESTRALAFPHSRHGHVLRAFGMAFYDVPALFAAFQAAGIKLAKIWDEAAFKAAVKQDARDWVRGRRRYWGPRIFAQNTAPMIPILRAEGMAWMLKAADPKAD